MACLLGSAESFVPQRCNVNDYTMTSESLTATGSLYSSPHVSDSDVPMTCLPAQTCFHDITKDWPLNLSPVKPVRLLNPMLRSLTNSEVIKPTPTAQTTPNKFFVCNVLLKDYESWPTSSRSLYPLMKVSPGFVVRLRGYDETQEAMRMGGETVTARCSFCKATFLCIKDAEFVLCQACRFINPLQQPQCDFYTLDDIDDFELGGGLVLGLIISAPVAPPCFHMPGLKHRIVSSAEDDFQPLVKKVKCRTIPNGGP